MIDTHAHLYLGRFNDDRDAVIERAREAGIEAIVMPAINVPSIHEALELCEHHDGLYAMAALHPSETQDATEADFEAVADLCDEEHVVAVGESGLDYHWDRSFDEKQQDFFRRHARLAIDKDLPLILHNREATGDLLDILGEEKAAADAPERLRGILHCFVDPPDAAERARDLDFLVGLGGILTFTNSEVDHHAQAIPMKQIVIETDAPYLAPEPHRGERNEPAYVRRVAEDLAEAKGLSLETVVEETTAHARRLFGLPG